MVVCAPSRGLAAAPPHTIAISASTRPPSPTAAIATPPSARSALIWPNEFASPPATSSMPCARLFASSRTNASVASRSPGRRKRTLSTATKRRALPNSGATTMPESEKVTCATLMIVSTPPKCSTRGLSGRYHPAKSARVVAASGATGSSGSEGVSPRVTNARTARVSCRNASPSPLLIWNAYPTPCSGR
jgi:hypothetical protein